MSFILEALRKSEAERRRGQTPDLLSEAIPVAPAARAAADRRGPIAVVVASALIAWLLVLWAMRPSAPAAPSATPAQSPTQLPTQSPTQLPAAAAVAVPPLSAPGSLSPPQRRVEPVPAPQTGAPAASPAPAQTTVATVAPAITSAPSGEPRVHTVEPRPAATPAPAPVATNAPASVATFTSPDVPLNLAELSTEERQQLPALKISMHMWGPDAANRFAIIDGTRVNEGDRIGEATVEAIQQEGVMLSWRGRRIRLQIR